ncbi:MAG TPA: NAD-dependent epimerase/dehydratase family protein [Planctomycetaceae bacterium]|nr:NAD-dependent epimerase/dehydratase family protein [Planctomycetaceae bacterium]
MNAAATSLRSAYAGRRILITGGLGFIGSNLAISLAGLDARVTVADSMIPAYGGKLANIEPVRDRIHVNFSDVRDRHSMAYLVRGQDLIFSLAGQLSHIDSMHDPFTDLEINCSSQLSLLETCRKLAPDVRIVFASTRQLYGRPQYLPVDERHPTRPVDVNGINKLAAEMYYSLYHDVYGMRTVNLRMTNTYGPRMDLASDSKGFLGQFIRRALRGERIRIFGDGRQRRDFNYVDDAVEALLLAGMVEGVEGRSFNLGYPRAYSLLEVVELLHELAEFDSECVPFPPEQQAIDIGDYFADFSAYYAATGWTPQVDLPEGLRRTLAFFRENRDESLSG